MRGGGCIMAYTDRARTCLRTLPEPWTTERTGDRMPDFTLSSPTPIKTRES